MNYTDYSIISGLAPRRTKKDFLSWVDVEFAETILDTPENRVSYIGQMMSRDSSRHSDEGRIQVSENMEHGSFVPQDDGAGQGRDKQSFIHDLEASLIPVLARMEYRGVAFDKDRLTDIGVRIRSDIHMLETEIHELVGPINISSPKQLQVLFFETLGIKPTKKNKTGYSVDVDVLEEIAKTYDIARLILEYRTLSKLASTYVDGLMKSVSDDNRIHTTYDSLGAATGRMSSNDPNLQNIPTGDGYSREIKECFVASEGALLLVADYSQIELRILAFLSQDANLLEAFEQGEDIHARTAYFLFAEKVGGDKLTWKATSEQRRIAKSVNFGVIYGITGFGLAKTLDCNPWEAQQYVEAFYIKYPGVRSYYDELLRVGKEEGYVETYFGRRRYIPGLSDANKTIRSIAEREAMNMPVQGTAADIIKIAMVELDAQIRELKLEGKMILQVHDELVFDIPTHEKEVFEKLVREVMENVITNYQLRITNIEQQRQVPPITVDISTGTNWAEAK